MRCASRLILAGLLSVSTLHAAVRTTVGGALYPRFSLDAGGNSFMLMGAEATVTAQVTTRTRDLLTAVVQLNAGTAMAGWTSGFHFGEAYALVPLGLRLPTVRVGQAVIPFGLMADYDVHSQVIQTPYARTLGLRLDPGIGVLGSLGPADYWLWISNGNGPFVGDNDGNKLITTRIAPTFLLGNAEVTVGLSGLAGSLPYWHIDSMDEMMMGPQQHVMKYRLGLDNTTDWGPLTLRLEAAAGRDSAPSGAPVFGYYAEARYSFHPSFEAIAAYDGFHAAGALNTLSAGVLVRHPQYPALELQLIYRADFPGSGGADGHDWQVISQLAIRV